MLVKVGKKQPHFVATCRIRGCMQKAGHICSIVGTLRNISPYKNFTVVHNSMDCYMQVTHTKDSHKECQTARKLLTRIKLSALGSHVQLSEDLIDDIEYRNIPKYSTNQFWKMELSGRNF